MLEHAADRLLDAIDRAAAPVCVGIDPVLSKIAPVVRGSSVAPDAIGTIRAFTLGVLDAVTGHVPCVKFQSACFERYGHRGVALLEAMMAEAAERQFEVILDAKRGDIGISAEHYAASVFGATGNHARADWVTISAYLGEDGIRPFLDGGGAAFALVRTSNPGGDLLQGARLADGRTVAECVGGLVATAGEHAVGRRGYSRLGAVVGATKPGDAARLREIMPAQIFLVPGVGAQGGGVRDVVPCFASDGRGALVTASRSVIYAEGPWPDAVGEAAERLADDVGRAVGLR